MSKALKALIIEDSEDDAFFIKRTLVKGGFDVSMQRVNSIAALQQALEQDWEVIISDYNLPGFDGLMALQLIRQKGLDIPFILVSGAVGEEFAVEAMRSGSQDYIQKDKLHRLVPVIERELRDAQVRRERQKVKELLDESEERYRNLIENIRLGVFRFSNEPPFKILMANSAFQKMVGRDANPGGNELSLEKICYDAYELERIMQFVAQKREGDIEIRLKGKDGASIWGHLNIHKGGNHSKPGYFDCTIEDITERKRAEKLREAVYNISQAANSAQSLKDLMLLIHHVISELMPAKNCYLAMYDPATNMVSFPYYVDERDTPPESAPLGKGLTDFVIRNGQPLLADPDVYDFMVKNGYIDVIGTPAVDWLGVPLKTADHRTIGALAVQTYDRNIRYTDYEKEVLTFVSSQTAMAIERKRAEEALRSSEARQRAILEAVPDMTLVMDRKGVLIETRVPENAANFPTYLPGQKASQMFPAGASKRALKLISKALATNKVQYFEYETQLPGESATRCYEARISNSGDDQVLVMIRDVTEQKQARQKLEEQRAFLRQVIDINPSLIFVKDRDGRFTLVNQAVADLYDTTVEELIGKKDEDFNPNIHEVEAFRRDDLEVIENQQPKFIPEEIVSDKEGKLHYLQTFKRPITIAETGETHVLGVATDITDRKRAEQQLVHSALHDTLTGLPNRALFLDRLGRTMERTRRHPATKYAVLLLDFDRFAMINDSLGHAVGDHLLIAASSRLESCLRTSDTIARIGGDEFVILLEDLSSVSDATFVAERLLEEMSVPFNLLGQKVVVTTSIGVVISSSTYEKPEDILRDADIAMIRAKSMGRGRYILFDNMMRADVVAHLELETDLRQATERKEIQLHYHPIIDIRDGSVSGFEALARWRHPRRGLIQPKDFIPFAEETNLIIPLGNWILREACHQIRIWHETYPVFKNATISVNISGKQLSQPDLIAEVENVLRTTGLEAKHLRLEITETSLIDNAESNIMALRHLRNLGVAIDIDDFGTGYSSLVYLHLLPINAIKIDRSFISGSVAKANGMRITQSIIRLAQDLNLETIAEGVDGLEQMAQLKTFGCHSVQGFLLSNVLEKTSIESFITSDLKRIAAICHSISS